MKIKNATFYWIVSAVLALSVALDQWTKWLAIEHKDMLKSEEINILGLFRLSFTTNEGAAWSMLEGQTWLFVLILVIFLALLVVCIWKKWIHRRFEILCLAAIAGGGIGNGIDRIFRGGKVVDMIKFAFWDDFPIFNIADCFITVGCIALVAYVLFSKEPKEV